MLLDDDPNPEAEAAIIDKPTYIDDLAECRSLFSKQFNINIIEKFNEQS